MNSFRHPITNVLKACGFCTVNDPGDLMQVEPDTFSLDPRDGWQLVNGSWAPFTLIPQRVTPLQAKRALDKAGSLAQVKSAVAAADIATQLAWESASSFDRNSPFILNMAAGLGWTSAQIDALFISAATFT
jgi:hypothetical protein